MKKRSAYTKHFACLHKEVKIKKKPVKNGGEIRTIVECVRKFLLRMECARIGKHGDAQMK